MLQSVRILIASLVVLAAALHAQGGVMTQQTCLRAWNADANDDFGWAVAAVGDTVVVGAIGESSNGLKATPP